MSEDIQKTGRQAYLTDSRKSAIAKYQEMVIGRKGFFNLLKYELFIMLFGSCPGALGLWLRKTFYPKLFASCGRNVVFGRNISIRHPHKIHLGRNIVINDDAVLDAKGGDEKGLFIGDGVFIGKGTILASLEGSLRIEEGANIGAYGRIATMGETRIGRKALISAYVYLVGADHKTDDLDIPIMDQENFTRGGIEIGDGTWIGAKVTVADGASIGANAIIGAHALVRDDVPDFGIAVGIPAKVVRSRKDN